jgi:ligand-binding sensor domain-containing protein
MKNLKVIMRRLTVITFLFMFLNSCNEKPQNNHSVNETNQQKSTAQVNGLNTAVNSIDNNIRSIFQDRNGNYWFGTNGAGAYRYDSKTLTQFTVKDGLADNQILSIQEDDFGNIWFGTGVFGISKFDGTKFTTYTDKVNITNGTETDWKSKNNELWFFAGGGVLRYSNPSLDYLPFDISSSNAQIGSPFLLGRYGVYCIFKDKKGNVWFGTQAEGVCRYDGKKLTWFKEKGLAGPAVFKTVRATFGLEIMVPDYSDTTEVL